MERALTCVDHSVSGEVYHLCRCRACGFLFTQDFPAEAEIGRYYETPDYISHSDTRRGLVNTVYHWARAYMLGRKARLVMREAHRTRGRLLDIGTGTGYFPHAMDERGWQVRAVEKNAGARIFAKEHFGLDVLPDHVLPTLPDGGFDVITLWHVMEHLEHLNETWEQLHRLLDDGGVLVVAVPNCSSADARRYGSYWAAYDVPRHRIGVEAGAWFHPGRTPSHAAGRLLRVHADGALPAPPPALPARTAGRHVGLVQHPGCEGAQQLHDLCVPEKTEKLSGGGSYGKE